MFNKFCKNEIHARIFRGPPNHIPPITSNHVVNLPDLEAAKAEKRGFRMPPLPYSYRIGATYTICLKSGKSRPFYVKLGKRTPVGTSPQILTEKTLLFRMGSFQMKAKPLLFK